MGTWKKPIYLDHIKVSTEIRHIRANWPQTRFRSAACWAWSECATRWWSKGVSARTSLVMQPPWSTCQVNTAPRDSVTYISRIQRHQAKKYKWFVRCYYWQMLLLALVPKELEWSEVNLKLCQKRRCKPLQKFHWGKPKTVPWLETGDKSPYKICVWGLPKTWDPPTVQQANHTRKWQNPQYKLCRGKPKTVPGVEVESSRWPTAKQASN